MKADSVLPAFYPCIAFETKHKQNVKATCFSGQAIATRIDSYPWKMKALDQTLSTRAHDDLVKLPKQRVIETSDVVQYK